MDTHTFFLIMRNEMKLQMRSWVFRFFIVLSLVGIVAYQMYIHGAAIPPFSALIFDVELVAVK